MKTIFNQSSRSWLIALVAASLLGGFVSDSHAQGGKRNRADAKSDLGVNPAPVGSKGVVWYATWDSAKAEAKRSGRAIFFMTAAYQCSKVPGVY